MSSCADRAIKTRDERVREWRAVVAGEIRKLKGRCRNFADISQGAFYPFSASKISACLLSRQYVHDKFDPR